MSLEEKYACYFNENVVNSYGSTFECECSCGGIGIRA